MGAIFAGGRLLHIFDERLEELEKLHRCLVWRCFSYTIFFVMHKNSEFYAVRKLFWIKSAILCLIAQMTFYIHPFMENTDDKNVSIGEWGIENEMVTGPESIQVLSDVTIWLCETECAGYYLPAGGYKHIVILVRLSFRPSPICVVPYRGQVLDRLAAEANLSHCVQRSWEFSDAQPDQNPLLYRCQGLP